jgi:hypothetical protein
MIRIIKKLFQRKYRYFVSYSWTDKNGSGFGSLSFRSNNKLNNSIEISNLTNFIKSKQKFENIVILNWIRLK